jgi:hypothetical protein
MMMATRSSVAMATAEGIRSVYVHWDGYPAGVGATLEMHYQDPTKLSRLMDRGDLSVLAPEIGESNSFEPGKRNEDVCLFYQDRGEQSPSIMHQNIGEWISHRKGNACEYGYFWNGEKFLTYTL